MRRNDKEQYLWFSKAICFAFMFLLALVVAPKNSSAQQTDSWALQMFNKLNTERTHNFGDIALHAEAEHHFIFENIYKEDVEILSAQANCSCTSVSVSKKRIKSHEKGEIIARVDTSGKIHTGKRKVTITVRFARPTQAEVQLQIQAFIRSDVVFNPGSVEFGSVALGEEMTKTVYLEYHGSNPNWKLVQLKKTNDGIKANAKLVPNNRGGKMYEVAVTLKNSASSGYIDDLVQFISNEGNQSIFIPVHALVRAPLTVTPTHFQLGVVHPGEKISKNLVICGDTPFEIERISSPDNRLSFLTANQKSPVHVVPITFQADDTQLGEIHQTITVKTNQKETKTLEVEVTGFVSKAKVLPKETSSEPSASDLLTYSKQTPDQMPIALGLTHGIEHQIAALQNNSQSIEQNIQSTSALQSVARTDQIRSNDTGKASSAGSDSYRKRISESASRLSSQSLVAETPDALPQAPNTLVAESLPNVDKENAQTFTETKEMTVLKPAQETLASKAQTESTEDDGWVTAGTIQITPPQEKKSAKEENTTPPTASSSSMEKKEQTRNLFRSPTFASQPVEEIAPVASNPLPENDPVFEKVSASVVAREVAELPETEELAPVQVVRVARAPVPAPAPTSHSSQPKEDGVATGLLSLIK